MVDLTVCILAYMHEEVLGELIESVLNQETTYKFDVIIGVDFCSDRTLDVANKFQESHPDLIKVVEHTTNVGGNGNYFDVLSRSKGRYVIIHDGDDVMLPGKLEKMIYFLESHPNCSLVAHPLIRANSDLTFLTGERDIINLPEIFGLDFLVSNCITLSNSQKMYRMPVKLPAEKNTIDFGMDIAHVGLSNIGFINEPLGIKRDFSSSVTKSKGKAFGVLTKAILDAFHSSFPYVSNKASVMYAMERFLVASLCHFALNQDKLNYYDFIGYLNEKTHFEYRVAIAIARLNRFPKLQYNFCRLLGWVHYLVTPWRAGREDKSFGEKLREFNNKVG
jgi:glycosyltransferase involved in cell wall biosynthesis